MKEQVMFTLGILIFWAIVGYVAVQKVLSLSVLIGK